MFMLIMAFFITVTLFVYGVFIILGERNRQVKKRLALVKAAGQPLALEVAAAAQEDEPAESRPTLWRRLISPVRVRFRRSLQRRMDEQKQAKIELLLLQAGKPFHMSPVEFRMLQMVTLLAFPALCAVYSSTVLQHSAGVALLVAAGAAAVAWRLPFAYLSAKAKARAKKALKELPDVLDLLTVSLEAGLGFDGALGKLVSKTDGILASEFHRCLEEIRLGRTRREALLGVRDRITLDEIRSLIGSILQAEKLGIGMVQVMRVQSVEIRDRRRQRAEEQAMKAPIKMLFPLVFFIFPCLFIVLLGPVVIGFIGAFSGGGTAP